MDQNKAKLQKRKQRHSRVRAKIKGVDSAPRLSVFRSNKGMQVQLIDDVSGKTLVSANISEVKGKNKTEIAKELGKLISKKALEKKISRVVFDKGGYKYHGRVKAFADGAREGGLQF